MFESLFGFLEARWEDVKPWAVIRSYERGVRFRFGVVDPIALEPGFHWRVPFWEHVELVTVVQDALQFGVQSVLTRDRKSVSFQVGITYTVADPVAHFCMVTDFHTSLQTICEVHLAKRVGELTLDELCGQRDELEKSMRRSLGQRVGKWGVDIIDAGLTSLQTVRAIQLYGAHQAMGL
jgi:regulator of protease activity HflC (stomatin/prohibitin superfamily)